MLDGTAVQCDTVSWGLNRGQVTWYSISRHSTSAVMEILLYLYGSPSIFPIVRTRCCFVSSSVIQMGWGRWYWKHGRTSLRHPLQDHPADRSWIEIADIPGPNEFHPDHKPNYTSLCIHFISLNSYLL